MTSRNRQETGELELWVSSDQDRDTACEGGERGERGEGEGGEIGEEHVWARGKDEQRE